MSDLISRQAAIDEIGRFIGYLDEDMITRIKIGIKKLPSAQPEQLERCPIYDGVCGYPSDQCYDCPRHHGAQPEQHWIPCSERMPEEDHWLGGSGRQFSDEVLVSVANYDDEDIWTYISQTIDGEWALELPRHCKIIAWMPLPEPYAERRTDG